MHDWPFFKAHELRCKCGNCDGGEMNRFFMRRLISLRESMGFAFIVTSAYRCPDYNDRISSTGRNGPHTTGRAIDIAVFGAKAQHLIQGAHRHGILGLNHGGLGVSQKGKHKSRFIHLDDLSAEDSSGPRPWVWTY